MYIRKKNSAFTIIEILIAIVILTVGILGILAIFPRAIKSASKSIEDTYAGIVAQSVMDAVKVGVQETKTINADTPNKTAKYFLIQHDGVGFWEPKKGSNISKVELIDLTKPKDVLAYRGSILLPSKDVASNGAVWIYPKTNLNENHFKAGAKAPNDKNDLKALKDIYAFGGSSGISSIQDELNQAALSPAKRKLFKKDPYLAYGFALVVNKSILSNNQTSDDLYMFSVWIFRNWTKGHGKAGQPARRLNSLVAF